MELFFGFSILLWIFPAIVLTITFAVGNVIKKKLLSNKDNENNADYIKKINNRVYFSYIIMIWILLAIYIFGFIYFYAQIADKPTADFASIFFIGTVLAPIALNTVVLFVWSISLLIFLFIKRK